MSASLERHSRTLAQANDGSAYAMSDDFVATLPSEH